MNIKSLEKFRLGLLREQAEISSSIAAIETVMQLLDTHKTAKALVNGVTSGTSDHTLNSTTSRGDMGLKGRKSKRTLTVGGEIGRLEGYLKHAKKKGHAVKPATLQRLSALRMLRPEDPLNGANKATKTPSIPMMGSRINWLKIARTEVPCHDDKPTRDELREYTRSTYPSITEKALQSAVSRGMRKGWLK